MAVPVVAAANTAMLANSASPHAGVAAHSAGPVKVNTVAEYNEWATDILAAIRVRCSIAAAALNCVTAVRIRLPIARFRLTGVAVWVAAILIVPAVGHCARVLGGEVVWKCLAYVGAAEATETCADRRRSVRNVCTAGVLL